MSTRAAYRRDARSGTASPAPVGLGRYRFRRKPVVGKLSGVVKTPGGGVSRYVWSATKRDPEVVKVERRAAARRARASRKVNR